MKTYLRVLSYRYPLWQFLPRYLILSLLGVIFGLINFTLFAPLLEVLFRDTETIAKAMREPPAFSWSVDFVKAYFQYHFSKVAQEHGQMGALRFVCFVIAGSVFLATFFRYSAFRLINNVRVSIIEAIRRDLYDKLLSMHVAYFNNERKGDLISRFSNDVQEVENGLVGSLRQVFKGPLTVLVSFVFLFYISLKMTLFTIIFLPVSGLAIAELTKRLKKHGRHTQHLLGQIMSVMDETLSGIKIVKAFAAEETARKRFKKENENYTYVNRKTENKRDLASPLSEFLGVWVMIGIILFGGSLVIDGELEDATFVTYLIIFSQVISPIKTVSGLIGKVQRGLASAERLFELLELETAIRPPKQPKPLAAFNERIQFEDLSFAYTSDRNVLENINFEIKKGQMIALVGPSGGGKSTLADLLPRFYDPKSGNVKIDGIDLREISIPDIRKQMGVVTQEAILFNDSIFNNIAFGKSDATLEEVTRAARIANAHDFIEAFPEGYQTNIGDRGAKLSGGQRQRISIARAVLKNPPILILDEATSALDSESERLVQDALQNLMESRTSLVIAHRLSTIRDADQILVIQEGRIVERGTHESLLQDKENSVYKKLVEMQQVAVE